MIQELRFALRMLLKNHYWSFLCSNKAGFRIQL
jgi:hypothetical protein